MSRITQRKLPNKDASLLPDIKDENGDKFTSILDDIPARDGIKPTNITTTNKDSSTHVATDNHTVETQAATETNEFQALTQQIVLFISSKDEAGLDGNLISKALVKNGLQLGENDIYHYFDQKLNNKSLFRIANGVAPWTLTEQDLDNKKLAGLSIVMLPDDNINGKIAIPILLSIVEKISIDVNGTLKNKQQQLLTQKDKDLLLI